MTSANDLFRAVCEGDRKAVHDILKRHPDSVRVTDHEGATPLHYATERGDREIVRMLLDAGADINARDSRFNATPAGWAIEYLRQRGGLLAVEIEDARRAIEGGDVSLVARYVARFPALRGAVDGAGTPLKVHARNSGNREIARLFDE